MRTLFVIFVWLFSVTVYGQENSEVVLTDFVRESQQWIKKSNRMSLSWWIPQEYWRISLAGNTQIPEGTLEKIENVFQNYTLICALDMTINPNGTFVFNDESEIRKTISILDDKGIKHFPLTENEISAEANAIAENIKPVFAQALGQMGKGMHLFFFVVQNDKKENLINAEKSGEFTILHSNCEFKWSLPLSTLLPTKTCPVDNSKMNGSWMFCPNHGVKLDK